MDAILYAVGSRDDIRLWTRVVGVGRAIGNNSHVIRFGLPGESDLDGIIAPCGRKLSIEVKTGNGKLSREQQNYRAMVEKFGGAYIEARLIDGDVAPFKRSVEAVLEQLKRFI